VPVSRRNRLIGASLAFFSAFFWSLNGLYTRLLTIDVWTTLAGRGIAAIGLMCAALLILHGRAAGGMVAYGARYGAIAILCGSASMITFVGALFNTTVANVTVIYAVSPLIAAVLARLVIGDRLVARTLVAFAAALAGVAIMVRASFGTNQLLGDFLALMMSITFAVVVVEMRRKPGVDNLTATLLMSILTVAAMAPFASFAAITAVDAVVLVLFSFTSNILGFFLFIAAVRKVPPAEAGLVATIEIVLAPFWVWLAYAEKPGAATVAGGAIVLAAIVFHLMGELRAPAQAQLAAAAGEPELKPCPSSSR
jgi:drug/metabolite transporter (DMT)-like permease